MSSAEPFTQRKGRQLWALSHSSRKQRLSPCQQMQLAQTFYEAETQNVSTVYFETWIRDQNGGPMSRPGSQISWIDWLIESVNNLKILSKYPVFSAFGQGQHSGIIHFANSLLISRALLFKTNDVVS